MKALETLKVPFLVNEKEENSYPRVSSQPRPRPFPFGRIGIYIVTFVSTSIDTDQAQRELGIL